MTNHEGNVPRSVPKYFGGSSIPSVVPSSSSSAPGAPAMISEPSSVPSVMAAMAPLSAPIDDFAEDEGGPEQPRPPQRAGVNQQQQPRLPSKSDTGMKQAIIVSSKYCCRSQVVRLSQKW